MESHTLDILYAGFVEWQRKIKGYQTCPDKEAIRQWVQYIDLIEQARTANQKTGASKP